MLQIDLLLERGKDVQIMDNKIQEAMGSITKHSKLTETLEFCCCCCCWVDTPAYQINHDIINASSNYGY